MKFGIVSSSKSFAALLLLSTAASAWAQSRGTEIVVTATREQQEALAEIEPERSVTEDEVSGYGASTIGEVLDAITSEMGDTDEPVLFVNGIPITDPGDIVDYPAEAIERIDVLPRGAGARLGARTDRRAYNVVLKRVFASNIGTVSDKFATDGEWNSLEGELFFSRIAGQKRMNLTLRARDESTLLESERGLLQPAPNFPYSLDGNLIPDPRFAFAEIDPLLSAAAGQPVAVAGLPLSGAATLVAFAARADQPNVSDLGQFRTLRPATRAYEASINLNRPLSSWLSGTFTGRLSYDRFDSLQGLRAGLFVLPDDNPTSPFSRPVGIARYFADDPLASRSTYLRGNAGMALNATRGPWQLTLRGDYRYSRYRSDGRRQSSFGPILLGSAVDPFADDLSSLVTAYRDRSSSLNQDSSVQVSATGPLFELPAGPVRLNLNGALRHVDQSSVSDNPFFQSRRSFDRDERTAQSSLEIPLTSREQEFLGTLGDLSLTLDYAVTDIADLATIERRGVAANWQPLPKVNLQASYNRQELAPDAQQLGDPVVAIEGVRYFDVVTGQTVDLTQISGGNPDLLAESVTTRRLSATGNLPTKADIQLNAEYTSTRRSNPISLLPPTSAELLAAFPDRFIRDADGRLVSVDVRPINFVSRSNEQFRWGAILSAPLSPVPEAGVPVKPGAPKWRLQATLSHVINLSDEVLARPSFPIVDLLSGGAIGFGGGTTRHLLDAGLNVNDRDVGVRLNASWRSASRLNTGSLGSPGQLRFGSLALFNVRTFAALNQLWPEEKWLKGSRISFNVVNLLNERQDVRDEAGTTPLRYQPGYRDPLGRTVELEFRKTF